VIDKKGKKPIKYEEHDFKQITKNKTKKIAKNEKIKVDNKLKLEESSKSNEQSENEKLIFHETKSKKRRNRRKKQRNKGLYGKIL